MDVLILLYSAICSIYRTIALSSINVLERGAFGGLPELQTLYVNACYITMQVP